MPVSALLSPPFVDPPVLTNQEPSMTVWPRGSPLNCHKLLLHNISAPRIPPRTLTMHLSICEKVHPCLSKLKYANLCNFCAKSTVSCITGICGTVLWPLEHWTYHRIDTAQRCMVCSWCALMTLHSPCQLAICPIVLWCAVVCCGPMGSLKRMLQLV